MWTRQRGTSTWDRANGAATDGEGNIYVAGTTTGSLDGNINVDPGGGDLVLIKFDGMGDWQWTRQTGGAGGQWANGVAVDGVGNIYAVGASTSAMYSQSYLVVKYDSAGNRI
ncbi:MAG: SBBP repeat-containing protein [Deltaproteobacteria bacterium]|nr:SBBP repeat-containing protein [Deltaproteobacteria bacterium]